MNILGKVNFSLINVKAPNCFETELHLLQLIVQLVTEKLCSKPLKFAAKRTVIRKILPLFEKNLLLFSCSKWIAILLTFFYLSTVVIEMLKNSVVLNLFFWNIQVLNWVNKQSLKKHFRVLWKKGVKIRKKYKKI